MARRLVIWLPRCTSSPFCRRVDICRGNYQLTYGTAGKAYGYWSSHPYVGESGCCINPESHFSDGTPCHYSGNGILVFPLIAYFLFLSIYLVGSWQPDLLTTQIEFNQNTLHQIWISIPVMVFAFSHTPIISTFAIDRREKYGEHAMDKCKKIMKVAYLIICISVLFFVFSCLLSIPPSYIEAAKEEGVTILSALSMLPNAPAWLSISGIIVAVVAMSKSFLGTYFGVIEGATEVVKTTLQQVGVKKSRAFNRALSIMLVSLITFIVCCINPNAISMIYAISGPLIAMILFIMPTLSTYLIPALKPWRSIGNLITLIVGILCVSVMFFS